MKKQGMGGSAFFCGSGVAGFAGWCGVPIADRLHEKEYYTAFL